MPRNSVGCVAVLLCLAALLSVSYSRRRPFRSIKAPVETVEIYSVVVPEVTHREQGDGPFPKALQVVLAADDFHYTLVLERNDVLIPTKFTSHYFDENGKERITKGQTNCYYQGTVKERPKWQAVINLCSGLQGTFGVHGFEPSLQRDLYHIEPLNPESTELSQPHAVYLDTEFETENGTCGSHSSSHDDHIRLNINNTLSEKLQHDLYKLREKRQSGQQFLFVELVMVNDRSQYLFYSSNLENTVRRSLDIANHMDTLFRVLNVRIALVEVITWTTADQITIVNDPRGLLDNFRTYISQVSTQHDSLMLLTHIDLSGSTIGIAFTSTMCSATASVGLTQDTGRSESSVGATATHELGHIMNMDHDDESNCNCPDGQSQCIMAATITFNPPDSWSQCSIDDLNSGFNNRNLDRCLFNEPTTVVGDPVCGNGIQEDGEACDCGSAQECTNPCCNANTCQLADNAECSSGTCCDLSTCQHRPYGTSCRSSTGECDIAEFCPGDSQECPVDTYRRDGNSCNNNNDYCFEGTCQTYNSQCRFHFNSNKGDDRCYSVYNDNGDVFGNCGYTMSDYIPCAASDVNCGMLFCQASGQYQQTAGVAGTVVTVGVSGGVQCLGFTPQPGTDIPNPALVADGTRCGTGRACYSQECISVNSLPTVSNLPSCPVRNGQSCSGNGECNNLGGCSCNVGFTGNDCGSTTSGPGVGPVNECSNNNGGCDHICMDTDDSFNCLCNSGYTLDSDGTTCNDINECTENTDGCAHTCTNTAGSFRCSCRNGYRLAPDGRGCNDLDECATSNGGCEQTCTNTDGSFSCSCSAGYVLDSNGRDCNDVDECGDNNAGCSHMCNNVDGSFTCSCRTGFELEDDGKTCKATVPCEQNDCEQDCSGASGIPMCSCRNGYTLGEDEKTCNDVNECAGDNGGCAHTCTNKDGTFECGCPPGYALGPDFMNCTDVNECAEDNGGCSHTCTNMEGNHTCSCNSGYELDTDLRTCLGNSSSTQSGSNVGAIAGGVVGALLAVGVVIAIILLVVFLCKRSSKSNALKTTKYSRPNYDLDSNSSRQNLFTTYPDPSTPAVDFRGHQNQVLYTGYTPPAPQYSGASPPVNSNQSRRPPPRPPTNQTAVPQSQPPPRRTAPAPPPAKRPAPVYPPPTAPLKPPAPSCPKPQPSAPSRPLLPTKPAIQPLSPPSSNNYVPPSTAKPPPLSNKPVLQSRPPPPLQKPPPAVRPPIASKPSPAPKPTPSAPSKANIQWPPPAQNNPPSFSSSAAPAPAKRPMAPPPKKPMVPPKK